MIGLDHGELSTELLTAILVALTSLAGVIKVILTQRQARQVASARHGQVMAVVDAVHAAGNSTLTASLRAQLVALQTSQALRQELLIVAENAGLPTDITRARIVDTDALIATVQETLAAHQAAVNTKETPP